MTWVSPDAEMAVRGRLLQAPRAGEEQECGVLDDLGPIDRDDADRRGDQ
jgi:hypothetical protein